MNNKIKCPCGALIVRRSFYSHKYTWKHMDYIADIKDSFDIECVDDTYLYNNKHYNKKWYSKWEMINIIIYNEIKTNAF